MNVLKKNLKWIMAVVILVLLYYWATSSVLNSEWINNNLLEIKYFVTQHPIIMGVIYYSILTLCISFSVPVTAMMTILSGMIFPLEKALFITMASAMTGASLNFYLTKHFMSESIEKRYGSKIDKINNEISENGSYYLLTLRLVPLFPFVVVNLAFGLTKMAFKRYFWMTLVGILPGTYAYVSLGRGLQFLQSESMSLRPEITTPLMMIGVLSMMPVIYKKIKKQPKKKNIV